MASVMTNGGMPPTSVHTGGPLPSTGSSDYVRMPRRVSHNQGSELVVVVSLSDSDRRFGFSLAGGADPFRYPQIDEIYAGSPASHCDLQVGDEVLEVNGRSLCQMSHEQIITSVHKCLRARTVILRVCRAHSSSSGQANIKKQNGIISEIEISNVANRFDGIEKDNFIRVNSLGKSGPIKPALRVHGNGDSSDSSSGISSVARNNDIAKAWSSANQHSNDFTLQHNRGDDVINAPDEKHRLNLVSVQSAAPVNPSLLQSESSNAGSESSGSTSPIFEQSNSVSRRVEAWESKENLTTAVSPSSSSSSVSQKSTKRIAPSPKPLVTYDLANYSDNSLPNQLKSEQKRRFLKKGDIRPEVGNLRSAKPTTPTVSSPAEEESPSMYRQQHREEARQQHSWMDFTFMDMQVPEDGLSTSAREMAVDCPPSFINNNHSSSSGMKPLATSTLDQRLSPKVQSYSTHTDQKKAQSLLHSKGNNTFNSFGKQSQPIYEVPEQQNLNNTFSSNQRLVSDDWQQDMYHKSDTSTKLHQSRNNAVPIATVPSSNIASLQTFRPTPLATQHNHATTISAPHNSVLYNAVSPKSAPHNYALPISAPHITVQPKSSPHNSRSILLSEESHNATQGEVEHRERTSDIQPRIDIERMKNILGSMHIRQYDYNQRGFSGQEDILMLQQMLDDPVFHRACSQYEVMRRRNLTESFADTTPSIFSPPPTNVQAVRAHKQVQDNLQSLAPNNQTAELSSILQDPNESHYHMSNGYFGDFNRQNDHRMSGSEALLMAHDGVSNSRQGSISSTTSSRRGDGRDGDKPSFPAQVMDRGDLRVISLMKNPGCPLGATVKKEGEKILVGRVVKGSLIDKTGMMRDGDEILEINQMDLLGQSVDDVCDLMAGLTGKVQFLIRPSQKGPELVPSATKGHSKFHVRALFDYEPEDDDFVPCKELALAFDRGDVLRVLNTEDGDWWQAVREGDSDQMARLIPSMAYWHKRENLRLAMDHEIEQSPGKKKKNPLCSKKKKKKRPDFDLDQFPVLTYEQVSPCAPNPAEPRPVVFVGPHFVGREELRRRLIELLPHLYAPAIPHTTRQRRLDEAESGDYTYITRLAFKQMINSGSFVEHGELDGYFYGTSVDAIRKVINSRKTCLLNLSAEALPTLRQTNLRPFVIFIAPPSVEILKRLRAAAGEPIKDEDVRAVVEKSQEMDMLYGHLFDAIVINANPDETFSKVSNILDGLRTSSHWVPLQWLGQIPTPSMTILENGGGHVNINCSP